jgi:hypothetical protein
MGIELNGIVAKTNVKRTIIFSCLGHDREKESITIIKPNP